MMAPLEPHRHGDSPPTAVLADTLVRSPADGQASAARPHRVALRIDLKHRLFRALWSSTWAMLAAWTPAPLHRWRGALLNLFGARVHAGARVYGSCRIWDPRQLSMENDSTLGPRSLCYNMAPVHLAEGAIVSQGAHLCTGTHDIHDRAFTLLVAPIRLEKLAWVAAEAFVGPGVVVNEGAVLAARGVAMLDLAAWTVYSGNPATQVKRRAYRESTQQDGPPA